MAAVPLYRGLLGSAWDSLPPAVRAMHDLAAERRAHGRAAVECGRGLLARLIRRMVGFPEAGGDVAVTVHFAVRDGIETWHRSFAGRSFSSTQEAGSGRWSGLLVERFGPLAFGLAIVTRPGGLGLVARRWSAFGVPLPLWLAPREESAEWEEAGRFRFDVAIRHPLTGAIVRYRGWLTPE